MLKIIRFQIIVYQAIPPKAKHNNRIQTISPYYHTKTFPITLVKNCIKYITLLFPPYEKRVPQRSKISAEESRKITLHLNLIFFISYSFVQANQIGYNRNCKRIGVA